MLTAAGFKRMRFTHFMLIIEEQAKELFGEDANLSERTPLGKFIRLQAYQRAEDNELAENIYNSRFVDTSEGVALEQNVARALITKKQWKKSCRRDSIKTFQRHNGTCGIYIWYAVWC